MQTDPVYYCSALVSSCLLLCGKFISGPVNNVRSDVSESENKMSERKKTVGGGGGAGGKEMKLTKKTKAVKEKDRSTLTCLDSIMRCRNCFELIYSGK